MAVFSRLKPLAVDLELPDPAYQGEGRIIHMEFEKFHFINGYFPNGGAEILSGDGKHQGKFKRLEYKMGFSACLPTTPRNSGRASPSLSAGTST